LYALQHHQRADIRCAFTQLTSIIRWSATYYMDRAAPLVRCALLVDMLYRVHFFCMLRT
jgi:hypothetical protein